MKKTITLFLALWMTMLLLACGGSQTAGAPATEAPKAEATAEPTAVPTPEPTAEPTAEPTPEPTPEPPPEPVVYQIGNTAKGELFNVRLDEFCFVRKIYDGRRTTTYKSGVSYDKVYDAVPVDGYTIAKITLTFTYNGKKASSLDLKGALRVDYDDGYIFAPAAWNGHMPTTQDQYSGYYSFNRDQELEVAVTNPLTFTETTRTIYIFMNDVVRTSRDKSLLLTIDLPTEEDKEQVTFNARAEETEEERKEALYREAIAYMEYSDYSVAITVLEELGEYKDSAALYREASLKYAMVRNKQDDVMAYLDSFTLLKGDQISQLFPGTWEISQGSNAWDFLADGKIDDHWGNARQWKIKGDTLILSADKSAYTYKVYEVYSGWYVLQDESKTDWLAIQFLIPAE